MDDNNGGAYDTQEASHLSVEIESFLEQLGGENSTGRREGREGRKEGGEGGKEGGEGGKEGEREGGKEGEREGGKEGEREGGKEGEREGGKEGEREGGKEGEREGGKEEEREGGGKKEKRRTERGDEGRLGHCQIALWCTQPCSYENKYRAAAGRQINGQTVRVSKASTTKPKS